MGAAFVLEPIPLRSLILSLGVALAVATSGVAAQAEPPITQSAAAASAAAPAEMLDTIVVTGEQPGPGLWKVTQGDHVLWVLGTLTPLPRRMDWRSDEVAARIAEADEVLRRPSVSIKADLGFFSGLALLPSLVAVRENPGHVHLDKILPPKDYARWAALKAKYMGRNPKVERWRPLFAAVELYEVALKKIGLERKDVVSKRVYALAGEAGVPLTAVNVSFKLDDPKAAARELKRASIDDRQCFSGMLEHIESDLGSMTLAANAWSTGDVEALRGLPLGASQWHACLDALNETQLLRSRGIVDVEDKQRATWMTAARSALERNRSSFAVLSISTLLAPDGYLQTLCGDGTCRVQAPDTWDDDFAPDAETESEP